MVIDYFFGYRCPIWLLSSTLGSLEDLLGPICHRWLAKRWKIDQVLPILVVEWGFETIGYAYLLHKTYFRPIHLYPTTLAVGAVPSDTTKEIILPWICWNPYSIAFKRSVLVITNSGYLQEEKGPRLFIYFLINRWFYTTNASSNHTQVSKESHFGTGFVRIGQKLTSSRPFSIYYFRLSWEREIERERYLTSLTSNIERRRLWANKHEVDVEEEDEEESHTTTTREVRL